jgi:hypothetical protein
MRTFFLWYILHGVFYTNDRLPSGTELMKPALKRCGIFQKLFRRVAARRVFIDESGAKTNMTRLRGRSRNGSRLFSFAPLGHWCTTTMIPSIRLNGQTTAMEVEGHF